MIRSKKNISYIFILQTTFLFTIFFVPTILPFKLAYLVMFLGIAIIYALHKSNIKLNSYVNIYFLALIPSFLVGLLESSINNTSILLPTTALLFIILNIFGVRTVFLSGTKQFHLDLIIKIIVSFTFILALLLIFEAFFYSPYYHILGITSVDPERAIHFLKDGVNSRYGVSEIAGVKFSRPFGPFRYPLLAGYALLLGSIYQFNMYLNKKSILNLFILITILFAILLISKSSFFGFVIAALWLVSRSNSITKKFKVSLYIFILMIFIPILYFVVLQPIISGVGIGSFLIRLKIFIFSIETFFSQSIFTILFGHGLGFTWYGNESFVNIYNEATADYGMYINVLLQGGIISLFIFLFLVFKVFILAKKETMYKNSHIVESSNAFLVATSVTWIGLSNYDILFWVFMTIGISEFARKLK